MYIYVQWVISFIWLGKSCIFPSAISFNVIYVSFHILIHISWGFDHSSLFQNGVALVGLYQNMNTSIVCFFFICCFRHMLIHIKWMKSPTSGWFCLMFDSGIRMTSWYSTNFHMFLWEISEWVFIISGCLNHIWMCQFRHLNEYPISGCSLFPSECKYAYMWVIFEWQESHPNGCKFVCVSDIRIAIKHIRMGLNGIWMGPCDIRMALTFFKPSHPNRPTNIRMFHYHIWIALDDIRIWLWHPNSSHMHSIPTSKWPELYPNVWAMHLNASIWYSNTLVSKILISKCSIRYSNVVLSISEYKLLFECKVKYSWILKSHIRIW